MPQQLADPNALADAGQFAQSPELWKALMALDAQRQTDQLIPPQQVPGAGAGPAAWNAVKQVPDALGIPDALKALRGQMTPTEAQDFAMQAAMGVLPLKAGPLIKKGEGLFEGAVKYLPRGYHGSYAPFEEFAADKAPYFFSPHPEVASNYATTTHDEMMAALRGDTGFVSPDKQPHVVPATLDMKNPYEATFADNQSAANARDLEWLKANGYDSAIIRDAKDPKAMEYVVLDRSQIIPKFSKRTR